MAIELKCGAIFLHIPKTGGVWVSNALRDQGLVRRTIGHRHSDMQRTLRHLDFFGAVRYELVAQLAPLSYIVKKRKLKSRINPSLKQAVSLSSSRKLPETKRPFTFCFVRNPLRWYESFWKYQCGSQWAHHGDIYDPIWNWHPLAPLNGLGSYEFNEFIQNIVSVQPGYMSELYNLYTLPTISFIGKQENLVEDLVSVLHILDVKFDEDRLRAFPQLNVSSAERSLKAEWDPELCAEVTRLEYAAMRRYGYCASCVGQQN